MSPFFANAGFHPRMSFGAPRPAPTTPSKALKLRNKEGNDFVDKGKRSPTYYGRI